MRRTVKHVRTKNRAEQLLKTPAAQRGSYKYINRETETINGVVHDITETIEIVPGEDGVTAADIKLLHSMDDHDVYENLKARRPELENWQKQIIADYKAEFIRRFKDDCTDDRVLEHAFLILLSLYRECVESKCHDEIDELMRFFPDLPEIPADKPYLGKYLGRIRTARARRWREWRRRSGTE